MRSVTKRIAAITAAAALIVTPAMASASQVPATPSANGWVTLSQLNAAGAVALGGSRAAVTPGPATLNASAVAVQPADAPGDYRPNPLPWPVIAVLLAVLGTAIYIAFIEDHGRSHHVFLTSPD